MRERGQRLGIRIDSGDLAWLAKLARRKLDDAGLTDTGIVLSNDLDEHTIHSIREQGAKVDSWGVGTKLATCYDQPTLGGVYKLSATRMPGDAQWTDRLKISESAMKLTVPGVLNVRRYYSDDGRIAGDMVYDITRPVDSRQVIVDSFDDLRPEEAGGQALRGAAATAGPQGKDGARPLAAKRHEGAGARPDVPCHLGREPEAHAVPPYLSGGLGSGPFGAQAGAGCRLRGIDEL